MSQIITDQKFPSHEEKSCGKSSYSHMFPLNAGVREYFKNEAENKGCYQKRYKNIDDVCNNNCYVLKIFQEMIDQQIHCSINNKRNKQNKPKTNDHRKRD